MRTTVTLGSGVERMFKTAMRERGVPFNEALKQAVRAGLSPVANRRRRRFIQTTFAMEAAAHFRREKAQTVADAIEDEGLTRKLSLRK